MTEPYIEFTPFTPDEKKEFDSFLAGFDTKLRCPQCRQGDTFSSMWVFNEEIGCDDLMYKCSICHSQWISSRHNARTP